MRMVMAVLALLLMAGCSTKKIPENPAAAPFNVQLGLGYLSQGDYSRAKEKLLRATAQAPDHIEPHLALAYYYETLGHPAAADQIYQHTLKMSPDAGQVNNNYGVFLCAQGEYEHSLTYLELAMNDAYYSHSARAYENAALCAAQASNEAAATRYASLAIRQDPSRSELLLKLSYLLEQQGNKQQAMHYLEQYHQRKS